MLRRDPLLRVVLCVLVATSSATSALAAALRRDGFDVLDLVLVAAFFVLFTLTAFFFCVAAVGCRHLVRLGANARPAQPERAASVLPLCAVVIPVHNEHAEQVFAAVRAMQESIAATGYGRCFELFVLSDTTEPDIWLREELAWAELRRAYPGAPIFYRRRARSFRKKSGNIADFCEQWGQRYTYMIVLDADCVMDGETMLELMLRMEASPKTGILQAPTLLAMRHSLLARREQFAAAVYGPVLTAGLAACFQAHANFWGHNAIIRLGPFIAHCGLPVLSGSPPLGGPLLSHDFVEAALMRRAGYEVRIAYDLTTGSYEQCPTSLEALLARDRRWCQGNLQHLRLLLGSGFSLRTRLHLGSGALFYAASMIWLVFVCAFGLQYARHRLVLAAVQADGGVDWATLFVMAAVGALWVLGKGFGVMVVLKRGEADAFGGPRRLVLSAVLETALGLLIAPIVMVRHTGAIVSILLGRSSDWNAAARVESASPLRDAWRAHRGMSVTGALGGALLWWGVPELALRLAPIWSSLMLAAPLAAALASPALGAWLATRRLLLSPPETKPSAILRRIAELLPRTANEGFTSVDRLRRVICDPWLNALHIGLLRVSGTRLRPRSVIAKLASRVSLHGASRLSRKQMLALLSDTWAMRTLHEANQCAELSAAERHTPGSEPEARK